MNEIIKNNLKTEPTNLTPIEIALGIDGEGRTTAKKLYNFLELESKNYSRWCKSKISENEFAIENIDFIPFVINEECGGQATTDYKLSASFAKKLAMGTHNKKGEAAKEYFIKVEDKLKEIAIKSQSLNTSELSPELQMFKQIFDTVAKQQLENKQIKAEIKETKEEIQGIREVVAINTSTVSWREDCRKIIVKIAHKLGGNNFIGDVNREIYDIMRIRLKVRLDVKLTNLRRRMADEGATVSTRNKMNYLDVIKDDARLVEGYVSIVKELAVKYGADIKEAM